MADQRVKRKRTLIKFAVQCTEYEEGKGATTSWKPIQAQIGTDESGAPIMTDCFYCEWGDGDTTAVRRRYPPRPRAYAVC